MPRKEKLSLFEAIFINITIMIGTGLFINTVNLAQQNGSLVAANYIITGLCMLPLVLALSKLVSLFPTGGFYTYAKETINPLAGFLSSWIYFFGKLGSCTISIHTFVSIMQQVITPLKTIPLFALDLGMIGLCVFLNTRHVKTGSAILRYFFLLKMIPLCTIIVSGCLYGTASHIIELPFDAWSLPLTMPLVIFTLLGFEASCSLSSKIDRPHINASRAILISYGLVIILNILYQVLFYSVLGAQFLSFIDYREAFPALFQFLIPNNLSTQKIAYTIIHAMIASSALSGGFGMMYSLMWNLPVLAEHNHLPMKSVFTRQNKYQVPVICALIEGCMCITYLLISGGDAIILQQLAALGCTITYTISTAGLYFYAQSKGNNQLSLLASCSFLGCIILTSICAFNLWLNGYATLVLLCGITAIGLFCFYTTKKN